MRVLRNIASGAIASLLLLVGLTPAAAHADPGDHGRPATHCPTDARTRGTNGAPTTPLEEYYLDDWRLGPQVLPRTGAIGAMLRDYHRTGPTSAYWFLGCYWQTNPTSGESGWWYPDHDGFVLDRMRQPGEEEPDAPRGTAGRPLRQRTRQLPRPRRDPVRQARHPAEQPRHLHDRLPEQLPPVPGHGGVHRREPAASAPGSGSPVWGSSTRRTSGSRNWSTPRNSKP